MALANVPSLLVVFGTVVPFFCTLVPVLGVQGMCGKTTLLDTALFSAKTKRGRREGDGKKKRHDNLRQTVWARGLAWGTGPHLPFSLAQSLRRSATLSER